MNIHATLKHDLHRGIQTLFGQDVRKDALKIQPTRPEFEGTHTLVAFGLAQRLGRSPAAISQALCEWIPANSQNVRSCQAAGGFLNMTLKDRVWLSALSGIMAKEDTEKAPFHGQKVMIEFSCPNTNKPMHLGHLRNNFLGQALAELLKATGHDVRKVNLINDRGIHICKSMVAYRMAGQSETPESTGCKGDHFVGKYYVQFERSLRDQRNAGKSPDASEESSKQEAPLMLEAQAMLRKWECGDLNTRALWAKMNGWVCQGFEETYRRTGIRFDQTRYESEVYLLGKQMVIDGLQRGVFYQKEDGSVWADLSEQGLDHKLLLRSDGTSVYITQDLGTADLRYAEYPFERLVYVVGSEQKYHFDVLRALLKQLGKCYAERIHHYAYGMVDLPNGRMKSREGTVVDADQLLEEMTRFAAARTQALGKTQHMTDPEATALHRSLALGALKYFLLRVDPHKRMLFDPDKSIDLHGDTGPAIQYVHARISSLLKKAGYTEVKAPDIDIAQPLQPTETRVISMIYAFNERIKEAALSQSPAMIAQYLSELARAYNQMYTEVLVLNEPCAATRRNRLHLADATRLIIRKGLALLGIDAPNRM